MTKMNKILVNFAHPAKSRSKVNKALCRAIEGIDGVTVNDLYEKYPDFMIDVEYEKQLCEAHDIIIFQHPFYWYSTPSIIKEWQDLVLEHGWAYGSQGKALTGKIMFQSLSTGGDESTYRADGYNRFTLKELTTPFQATAHLCGMRWLPPFATTGVHRGLSADKIKQYSQDYKKIVIALRDSVLNIEHAQTLESLNQSLATLKEGE